MNFKELRERADSFSINTDIIRDLRRTLDNLDSAIDNIRDVYSDLDSCIDDVGELENVESFLSDIVDMEAPDVSVDPLMQKEYVWRIASALLLAGSDTDIEIIKRDNPTVFWAAVSLALVTYPPFRMVPLTQWLLKGFPV